MKKLLFLLAIALGSLWAHAETFEAAIKRLPASDERNFLEIVESGLDIANKSLENVNDMITGASKLDINKVLTRLDETIDLYSKHTEGHKLKLLSRVEDAEAAMAKATPANQLQLRLAAAEANRAAGKFQRAYDILYNALGEEKTTSNMRKIFFAIIECDFDTRRYNHIAQILDLIETTPTLTDEDGHKISYLRARYCFETGDNTNCMKAISKSLEYNEKLDDSQEQVVQAVQLVILMTKALQRFGSANEMLPYFEKYTPMLDVKSDSANLVPRMLLAAAEIFADCNDINKAHDRCSQAIRIIQNKYPNGSELELDALILAGDLARRNSLLPAGKRSTQYYFQKGPIYYLNGCSVLAKRIWGNDNNPVLRRVNRKLAHAALIAARQAGEVEGASMRKMARKLYKNELETMRNQLRTDFTSMSDGQRSDYMLLMGELFNDTYNFAEYDQRNKDTRSMVYDACLLHKSMLLSFSRSVTRMVKATGNPTLIADNERLMAIRSELVSQEQSGDYSQSQQLRAQADELERSILKEVSATGDPTSFMATTWKDVRTTLGDKDIAVEFYTFRDNMSEKQGLRERYIYLQTGKNPEIVPLSYRQGPINLDERFQLKALYMQLWKPLVDKKILKPGMRVYFSPAGRWNSIPMEYLPCDNNRSMNDIYDMVRVSTTRSFPQSTVKFNNAVLFGGLDYNTDIEEIAITREDIGTAERGNVPSSIWQYLPGTMTEVKSINDLFSTSGINTKCYMGTEGIEETFKALGGQKHGLIHVATHGYWKDGENLNFANISYAYEDALDRAGLVFAGANHSTESMRSEGLDDGHLTAREIALLDLTETDMVVMSACESGIGGTSAEGVYGLQRGFKLAGAGTLVMSLWKVNDAATEAMMTHFYRGLIDGLDKRKAFRQAQAKIRESTFDGVPGSDPYIWNAFVIMD